MTALPAPGSRRRPSAPSRTPATLHVRAASSSAPQTRRPSSSVGPFFPLSRRAPACSLLLFPGEDRAPTPSSFFGEQRWTYGKR
ncbi:hypothetical protein J5N97_021570 [Dioscorea zingiberensis]|uniref:Uncharacterized protein n=1 Tax=Dioscorea zingiberensis TaxID=325984 RepID=A0A9D5C974_9LILI|nr:hypothetical protein J5N97_021570 [Dioscorea zingiberensis]